MIQYEMQHHIELYEISLIKEKKSEDSTVSNSNKKVFLSNTVILLTLLEKYMNNKMQ